MSYVSSYPCYTSVWSAAAQYSLSSQSSSFSSSPSSSSSSMTSMEKTATVSSDAFAEFPPPSLGKTTLKEKRIYNLADLLKECGLRFKYSEKMFQFLILNSTEIEPKKLEELLQDKWHGVSPDPDFELSLDSLLYWQQAKERLVAMKKYFSDEESQMGWQSRPFVEAHVDEHGNKVVGLRSVVLRWD